MTQKANFYSDNKDIAFHFKRSIDWNGIVPLLENGFTDPEGFSSVEEALDVYEQTLTLVGEFCGSEVAPQARAVDEEGVAYEGGEVYLSAALQQNLDRAKELGIMAVTLPRDVGGWNFPVTVNAMMLEIFSRACVSTMIQYGFYSGPARLIWRFGTDAIRRRYLPPMCSGQWSGAIAMTESEAGSDVGKIRTEAVRKNGQWAISGQKQFITNGGADVAVVLARSDPTSTGLDGLSLFVVPKRRSGNGPEQDNFRVSRVEHKICIHGSPTCELTFTESEAELLGDENEGFREILSFTNEARIAVGIQALGLMQAAYGAARDYAAIRVTMGKPIIQHELVSDMLVEMETQIRAIRSLVYEASAHADRLEGLEKRLQTLPSDGPDAQRIRQECDRLARHVRELTPLIKYYASEKCIDITRAALQIHGGYGVITEYDAQRYYRDAVVFPIYEGTSQIQALMVLKDTVKDIFRHPAAFLRQALRSSVRRFTALDSLERKLAGAQWQLSLSLAYVLQQTARQALRGGDDGSTGRGWLAKLSARINANPESLAYAKLHAERLTIIKTLVHISRILLMQAKEAEDRRPLAQRFILHMEPMVKFHAAHIRSGDRSSLCGVSEGGIS